MQDPITHRPEIAWWFQSVQDNICHHLEEADGTGKFSEDLWSRPEGGGGRTRIMQQGAVIEKGGVNFSEVYGPLPSFMQKVTVGGKQESSRFYATGVSIVIHPVSPMVPVIHMNVRYFETGNEVCWFGGGIDLTPHYVDQDEARNFHRELNQVCDRFHPEYYRDFKAWADEYFYIPHRQETRGIGGIFFDHLKSTDTITIEQRWEFVKAVADTFVPVYTGIMNRKKSIPFSEREKKWQRMRRGRYAEFNLVYDRGTKFGLETGGRTESILMSLPPQADWNYQFIPEPGTPEAETLSLLKKGIDWLS